MPRYLASRSWWRLLHKTGIENRSDLEVDPEMPLLWAIREFAGLTGTKFGCGMGTELRGLHSACGGAADAVVLDTLSAVSRGSPSQRSKV